MTKYHKSFKQQVIEFYLQNGKNRSLTLQQFQLEKTTFDRWLSQYNHHGINGLAVRGKKQVYYSVNRRLFCITKGKLCKKQQAQSEMIQKLSERLSQRIEDQFSDVQIRVRLSSSSGIDVSGFRDVEKKQVMEWLEDIWNDPFLLDD